MYSALVVGVSVFGTVSACCGVKVYGNFVDGMSPPGSFAERPPMAKKRSNVYMHLSSYHNIPLLNGVRLRRKPACTVFDWWGCLVELLMGKDIYIYIYIL